MDLWSNPFRQISSRSAPAKFISATALADDGDSIALILSPGRATFTRIELGTLTLYNRSGGAAVVGFGVRFPRDRWGAGTMTAAGVFTDATAAAQNETVSDLTLHDRTNSGSGIIIHAEMPFNIVDVVQSVAGDQTTPVLVLEYWNGTAWTNIASSLYTTDQVNPGAAAEELFCFPEPPGWVIGGSGTNVRQDRYNLRLRYTTSGAGTVNPLASQIHIGHSILIIPALADASNFVLAPTNPLRAHHLGDALFPVFSVANIKNACDVDVRFI